MPNTISTQDWLQVIEAEYLASFIRDGGSSVKIVVGSDECREAFLAAAEERCRDLGYVVVKLDSRDTRFHMPQDIFFGIGNQVDWRDLARRCILRLATERGYETSNLGPEVEGSIFEAVARNHSLEATSLYTELRGDIETHVARNLNMTKDFRVAMSQLCVREHLGSTGEYGGRALLDYLTGRNTRVSNVRSFLIASGINRTTARHFIQSALYWFQFVGNTGTAILLDSSRVTLARNPGDDRRYYTKAMTLDHYELLREFIDSIDQLSGCLLLVATSHDFLDQTAAYRGFGIYPALMTRVMDDVRDRSLVNPIASLVRLH